MAEKERVRERERPPLGDNPYERIMRQRKDLAERNLTGPVVIRAEDRQWYQTRQGKLRYYLEPVTFKIYEGFGQDENGIWSPPGGGAKVAWFSDPDGNVLSLTQFG